MEDLWHSINRIARYHAISILQSYVEAQLVEGVGVAWAGFSFAVRGVRVGACCGEGSESGGVLW